MWRSRDEHGFTLVELLATMALMAILLTLGVTALRFFWLGQSLYDQRDEVYTNLRALQQQVVSESNPIVIGAWFTADTDDEPQWGTVRVRPDLSPITCVSTAQFELNTGVQIQSASFADDLVGVDADELTDMVTACASGVPASADATDFMFFLARGTATAGCVTLTQTLRDMTDITVAVSTLTGRVERIRQDEVADRCP